MSMKILMIQNFPILKCINIKIFECKTIEILQFHSHSIFLSFLHNIHPSSLFDCSFNSQKHRIQSRSRWINKHEHSSMYISINVHHFTSLHITSDHCPSRSINSQITDISYNLIFSQIHLFESCRNCSSRGSS